MTTETPIEIIRRCSARCWQEQKAAIAIDGGKRFEDIIAAWMLNATLAIVITGPAPGQEAPPTSPEARSGVLTAGVAVDGGRKEKRARTKPGARCKAS